MLRRFGPIFAFTILAFGALALANDDVYLKGKDGGKAKKMDGVIIVVESAKEVALKSGQKLAPDDIEDIFYETPGSPVLGQVAYRGAFTADREWHTTTDAKKRAVAYGEALDKYQKAASQVVDKRAKTHIDFKIGYLRARKALEDGADLKTATPAITSLSLWIKANPNSWQVTRALMLLAKLQNDVKDYKGAAESYRDLAKLDVTDDVKNDARLQGALAEIQTAQYGAAEAKLNDLLKTLPKGTKTYARALVGLSDCMMATNKNEEAIDLLRKAIKESDDKGLRAAAHNTLGTNYYKAEPQQLKEARWEFLWVDVVYNHDKAEHARALYYLSHIFDKLAEADRAAQCRSTLLDPVYAGTEYQRKLQKEQSGAK